MSAKGGGPAFPQIGYPSPDGIAVDGMSIRDYFAGQALAGILARGQHDLSSTEHAQYAEDAYKSADAMLAARGGFR